MASPVLHFLFGLEPQSRFPSLCSGQAFASLRSAQNDSDSKMSSGAFTAFGLPIMRKNSTRVVFEHVVDSQLVPRRVSAERSEGSRR